MAQKLNPQVEYDKAGDVLYVTFGTGEPSYCEEVDDYIVLELGMFTHTLTGFRLIGAKENIKYYNLHNILIKVEPALKKSEIQAKKELSEREHLIRNAFQELEKEKKELISI